MTICIDCKNEFTEKLEESRCDKCWDKYWKMKADENMIKGRQMSMVKY